MEPVLVATMAQGGIGEASSKKVHPFFNKSEDTILPLGPTIQAPVVLDAGVNETLIATPKTEEPKKKRRMTDTTAPQGDTEPKQRRKRKSGANQLVSIASHLSKPEQGSRITEVAAPAEAVLKLPTPPLSDAHLTIHGNAHGQAPIINPGLIVSDVAYPITPTSLPPKKVLKFNPKTGTLGSPPKLRQPNARSHIVTIKYGSDHEHRKELGDKIALILEGKLQLPPTPTKQKKPRGSTKANAQAPVHGEPLKTPHPFFSGKPKNSTQANKPVTEKKPAGRNTVFMTTPISPKKQRNPSVTEKAVQFKIKSTGTKVPGAMYPLWPAQGMTHVRGHPCLCQSSESGALTNQFRKSKGQITYVAPHESVLGHVFDNVDLGMIRDTLHQDSDNFEPVPRELRLPHRHFESGRKLQKRIRSQLRTRLTDIDQRFSPDQLAEEQSRKAHPAIVRCYQSLGTQLSAYDKSSCESLIWTQKYAPTNAEQILQQGREAILLRQWLHALRVQSVETGAASDGDKSKTKSEGTAKKRRKKGKLDGFVIDSDSESSDLDEISDNEADWTSQQGTGLPKKSVIRSSDTSNKGSRDQARLRNAIVVSGPHGSGKTAAVLAVAKELDFEVFEINSSNRRSGKDIIEKVGDMTRNHLVQQHRAEEVLVDDDETINDIKSGKQGMMTTFFKPNTKPAPCKKPKAINKDSTAQGAAKNPPKAQKQSLILLEEVDILFEEDKQFWACLVTLIAQSKRPFIMTCNDESLVPWGILNLHAILRFSPPPSILAVDLCVLIAANEGHALQRSAVETLYSCRKNDLRATITELNYWCQIGVGDRRGGFDWFYLRWPKGSDLDENGDVVRVISENTFRMGMGWVGRDLISTTCDPLKAEEEALAQSWDSWQTDMGDWHNAIDIRSWANAQSDIESSLALRSATITAYADFCSAMSDADICAGGALGTNLQERMDPTLPDMGDNARDDYILGQRVLNTEPLTRQTSPNTAISMAVKSLSRNILQKSVQNISSAAISTLNSINEERAISILEASFQTQPFQLCRYDLAVAFDPIAISPKAVAATHLDASVFDRTLKLIVLDVAPWVRGIVAYEDQLMRKRLKLSNLLSQGGKRKRMRQTRSAYSALEGGERRTTRRERHFGDCLATPSVMRTGGEGWATVAVVESEREMCSEVDEGSAAPSSPVSEDWSSQ